MNRSTESKNSGCDRAVRCFVRSAFSRQNHCECKRFAKVNSFIFVGVEKRKPNRAERAIDSFEPIKLV
eukprot:scaffold2271_cov130-Cylindrotheca_fusiformis.AAC.24